MARLRLTLKTRISLVLTALVASLALAGGGLWLAHTRTATHEEVEAATRVAEQWLTVAAQDVRDGRPGAAAALLHQVKSVGRLRANALAVLDAQGRQLYASPPPVYKAGRDAPAWFTWLAEPRLAARRVEAGPYTLVLQPDPSRASLDAWDGLCALAGWGAALLLALFLASRFALARALQPLSQVMGALDATGRGRFDTRLPVYPVPELGRLARAFNGMADRLAQAVDENVRLDSEGETARRLQQSLELERRSIARELHDELAQGITAVRALAGAIAQRCETRPDLQGHAQSIVDVTGEMQDGVRHILQRLKPAAPGPLDQALGRYLETWRCHHPDVALTADLAAGALGDDHSLALLRIVQEGLTNIARHAGARRVHLTLARATDAAGAPWVHLSLEDDGRGLAAPSGSPGCGLGRAGMMERAAALGGVVELVSGAERGTRLVARLPLEPLAPQLPQAVAATPTTLASLAFAFTPPVEQLS